MLRCKPSLEQEIIGTLVVKTLVFYTLYYQGMQFPRFAVIVAIGSSLFNKEVRYIYKEF